MSRYLINKKIFDTTHQIERLTESLLDIMEGEEYNASKIIQHFVRREMSFNTGLSSRGARSVFIFAGCRDMDFSVYASKMAEALEVEFKEISANKWCELHISDDDFFKKEDNHKSIKNIIYVKDANELLTSNFKKIFEMLFCDGMGSHHDFNDLLLHNNENPFRNSIVIFEASIERSTYEVIYKKYMNKRGNSSGYTEIFEKILSRAYFNPNEISLIEERVCTISFNPINCERAMQNTVESMIECENEFNFCSNINSGNFVNLSKLLVYKTGADEFKRKATIRRFFENEIGEIIRVASSTYVDIFNRVNKINWKIDKSTISNKCKEYFEIDKKKNIMIFSDKQVCNTENLSIKDAVIIQIENLEEAKKVISCKKIDYLFVDYSHNLKNGFSYLNVEDIQSEGRELYEYILKEQAETIVAIIDLGKINYNSNDIISLYANEINYVSPLIRDEYELISFIDYTISKSEFKKLLEKNCYNGFEWVYESGQVLSEDKKAIEVVIRDIDIKQKKESDNKETKNIEGLKDDSAKIDIEKVENPNIHWGDIIVSNEIKEELEFFIKYLKNPDAFIEKGINQPKGLLMYGPPGTGKTSLAKVVATESNLSFFEVGADEFIARTYGSGETRVHNLFRKVRENAPAILFIDEIDAVGANRMKNHGAPAIRTILNAILTEMDGFKKDSRKPVFVMAATNVGGKVGNEGMLDPALVRRFDNTIEIGYPSKDDRVKYINLLRTKKDILQISDNMVENLAAKMGKLSFANIETMIQTAMRKAVRLDKDVDDEIMKEVFEDFIKILPKETKVDSDVLEVEKVENPNVSWEDVIVSKEVKQELMFFVKYLKNPQEFIAKGVEQPRGLLMYGPPGTGKTTLAKVVATESNLGFYEVGADEFLSSLTGAGENRVHNIFKKIRENAPAILFIDEIDAIGINRINGSNNNKSILNALLTEMDGFTKESDKPIFVIAATNIGGRIGNEGMLDPALVRRFDNSIEIGYPDKEDREKYIRIVMKKKPILQISDEMIENLAVRMEKMTPANIESVIQYAIRRAVRNDKNVDDNIMNESFESFFNGDINKVSKEERRRVAVHEAGHALVANELGRNPIYVTIISRGNYGGYTSYEYDESIITKKDLLDSICVSLSGRAAELVEYGDEEGTTTGPSSDIEKATHIVTQMICRYGMFEEIGMLKITNLEDVSEDMREKIGILSNKVLMRELERAKELITGNISQFNNLVNELIKENEIIKDNLKKILS